MTLLCSVVNMALMHSCCCFHPSIGPDAKELYLHTPSDDVWCDVVCKQVGRVLVLDVYSTVCHLSIRRDSFSSFFSSKPTKAREAFAKPL